MARLPIVARVGNAAAVLVGGWGAVSRQAGDIGCSRQAVYDHAEKVERAVRDAAGGGPSRADFRENVRQQRIQIAELQRRLAEAIELPEAERQRFAATAAAMGLSYSQTRELLGIVAKKNVPAVRRSRGGGRGVEARRGGDGAGRPHGAGVETD